MKRLIGSIASTQGRLVQSLGFRDLRLSGSIDTASRVLEEWGIDELFVAAFQRGPHPSKPDRLVIQRVADAAPATPLAYAGGIDTLVDARRVLDLGVDRVALSGVLWSDMSEAYRIVESLGQESVIAVMHVFMHKGKLLHLDPRTMQPRRPGQSELVTAALRERCFGECIVVSPRTHGLGEPFDEDILDELHLGDRRAVVWGSLESADQRSRLLRRSDVAGLVFDHRLLFHDAALDRIRATHGPDEVRLVP